MNYTCYSSLNFENKQVNIVEENDFEIDKKDILVSNENLFDKIDNKIKLETIKKLIEKDLELTKELEDFLKGNKLFSSKKQTELFEKIKNYKNKKIDNE